MTTYQGISRCLVSDGNKPGCLGESILGMNYYLLMWGLCHKLFQASLLTNQDFLDFGFCVSLRLSTLGFNSVFPRGGDGICLFGVIWMSIMTRSMTGKFQKVPEGKMNRLSM